MDRSTLATASRCFLMRAWESDGSGESDRRAVEALAQAVAVLMVNASRSTGSMMAVMSPLSWAAAIAATLGR